MSETLDLTECTICSLCAGDIFDFFKQKGKPIAPYSKYVLDITAGNEEDDDEEVYCEVCENELKDGEEYHKINVPYDLLITVADHLSKNIGGCEHCHGSERSWYEHTYNSDPFESSPIDVGGSDQTVDEYLSDNGVPDVLIPIFTKLVQCKCGYGRYDKDGNNPEAGIFKKYDDVYTTAEIGDFFGFEVEAFSKFAEKYDERISLKELTEFREILRTQPMLAHKHHTGQAIYNVLQKHFDAGDYKSIKAHAVGLSRGRTRSIDSNKPYTIEELWAPPLGKPSHGRYNFIGVPVLYVTDQESAIPYEVHPTHDQLIDIASFDILKKSLKLFDLGSFDPDFQGFFSEVNEDTNIVKSTYLLPNYIGACCSEIGYDGVMYSGAQQSEQLSDYTNYALFNMELNLDLAPTSEVKTYRPKFTIELELQEKEKPKSPFDIF